MSPRRRSKKRPCKICRKWFLPDPRVGDRQKTCGAPECQRKWHTKKCAEWNRKHRICSKENYLSAKLALAVDEKNGTQGSSAASTPSKSRVPVSRPGLFSQLPRSVIEEVIGCQHLVIIEYIAQLLFRSVQEVIRAQPHEIKRDLPQVLPGCSSRSDGVSRSP